ncbi:MAG: hypothetical protein OXD54_16325 [Candidatus Poribacteria bacterium]|nr:hypothetical protein [Candidatus Poribacteria bacterium]
MASEKNMISDLHFIQLDQANQRLAQNWNMLVKMRENGGLGETSRLIKAEMAYLHSLQLVMDAAENAILDEERRKRTRM